jgi:hypothetical protein
VDHGDPSSGSLPLRKRVTCTPFEWLYCTSSATSVTSSRSTPMEAEYVRGFWKSRSNTKTSG